MTDKQIKNLILTGEGYHIEFKQALEKSLIEEVCAFANSSGGCIFNGGSLMIKQLRALTQATEPALKSRTC